MPTGSPAACEEGLAELVVAEGRARGGGYAHGRIRESLREQIGAAVPPAERPRHDRVVIIARERLGETAFTAKWEEGWSLGRRMAALALEE